MERVIKDLQQEIRRIIEGEPLEQKREELGDRVDIRFCRMLLFSLLWASAGYQSSLRFAGMKLGKGLGTKCEKTELRLVLEEIKQLIEVLNAGRVEIEVSSEKGGLKVFEGAFSWGVPDASQELCFFEEGFIEGYLEGVISKLGPLAVSGLQQSIKGVNVKQERCVGQGDQYCEFVVEF